MSVFGTVIAVNKLKDGARPTSCCSIRRCSATSQGGQDRARQHHAGVPFARRRRGARRRAEARHLDGRGVQAGAAQGQDHRPLTGVSGVHFSKTVIPQLGIADQIKDRIRISKGFPVGVLVAKGEAEIGIHQIAELMPVKGIDIVGELPADIQTTLVYATGIHASAKQPEAARALAQFLMLETSVAAIRKNGMEPAPR